LPAKVDGKLPAKFEGQFQAEANDLSAQLTVEAGQVEAAVEAILTLKVEERTERKERR